MQAEFSLKHAKLHTNAPRPPQPAAKTEGPGPMNLSYESAVGQQKNKGNNVRCFPCGNRVDAGRPTGIVVTPVYNRNAVLRTAATSETESHYEVQDSMPNLVILKRVIRARFSYKHRVVVEWLLILDLDDKFHMVLGIPWLARHDPTIAWEKRTVVRFGRRGATKSDGPVSAADTPNGASKPTPETIALGVATNCFAVRRLGDNASTPGVDATSCVGG
ncbi:hypothetical protein PHMEG_0002749 [Phytophthora megakarya]|uniref:Reverse transcriptase n=1 Tax=Phytophthora megakarya TaxID=4795 RepID=A0A225WY76_9STRA|nr:hypothetical protein PHMEG_0002749 [Phytophthora megakarya]